MKQTLDLRIGQHLTITPQLQQAIRLLQLSSIELEQEIREVLEKNPLLEETDHADGEEAGAADESAEAVTADEARDDSEGDADPAELDWEGDYEVLSSGSGSGEDDNDTNFEARNSRPTSLGTTSSGNCR